MKINQSSPVFSALTHMCIMRVKLKMCGCSIVWMSIILMTTSLVAGESAEIVSAAMAAWKISIEPTTQTLDFGSPALFTCHFERNQIKTVNWLKDGKDINHHDAILRIESVKKEDKGIYQCCIQNDEESVGVSAELKVGGLLPPQFEIKQRNQTARRNEPAALQCKAEGEKPISILWKMNNKILKSNSDSRYTIRREILPDGILSELSIEWTERRDTAVFKCIAINAYGYNDTNINMVIQEIPEEVYDFKVLDTYSRSVQLSWVAPYDGNSPIKKYQIEYKRFTDTWEKDIDRVLVPSSNTEAELFRLHPATTYNLRIVAENELGISKPSDTVTIITAEEAPSAPPSNLKVEALDQHSLKVTWKPPPMQDWNGNILGYYIGYKLATDKEYEFEIDITEKTRKDFRLVINNLKTYTQYSVKVKSFNKMGSGPMSEEIKVYTAEGVPDAPPDDALCTTLTAQTIRVSWVSPSLASTNGVIKGYKVIYGPSDSWYDEKSKDTRITTNIETILDDLKKFTNYSIEVLATTSGGDGVRSSPISCQTKEDVPEAATAVKALVMSQDSVLISWRSPTRANGVITHYTVYTQSPGSEPTSNKVLALQMSYSVTDLKSMRYNFWVTASTVIGEGQPSPTVSTIPETRVPAKIASFNDSFTTFYKKDVKLPCLAVGIPPPSISWKVKGASLETSDRVRQLRDGSLLIAGVARDDAGNYTCLVENQFGTDSVTHKLNVNAPPFPPAVTLTSRDISALSLRLQPVNISPADGYTIHYKREFGDWKTIQVSSQTTLYALENLYCGSSYQVYVAAYNGYGTSEATNVLNARTLGSKPMAPKATYFMEASSGNVTLNMKQWYDGGCPMTHFVVENKKKGAAEWNQISNSVKPRVIFVVMDLEPATSYLLKVTGHNSAGFNVAEYEYATLNITEGESTETPLTATAPLKISIEPATQTVDLGTPVWFTCRSEGNPIETVNWLKDGKDINHHDTVLSINSVKNEDRGIYRCFIRNDQESAGADAELKVSEVVPLQYEFTRNKQIVRLGEAAVLQCKARREELRKAAWLKNNKNLKVINDSRYIIHEEVSSYGTLSELSIERTELGDNAVFACIARLDYVSFNLTIQDDPEAVYGLKVLNKSSRSVQLSWVAPYDGNSSIRKYRIEYKRYRDTWKRGTNRISVPDNTTEMEIFSLDPATKYLLRIITENGLGISKMSNTITIITAEEAPSAPPSDLKIESLDQDSLKVKSKPPPIQFLGNILNPREKILNLQKKYSFFKKVTGCFLKKAVDNLKF